MMLPPARQPAPRHWAGPTRRDTTGAGETIRARNRQCLTAWLRTAWLRTAWLLTAWLLTAYPQGEALITYFAGAFPSGEPLRETRSFLREFRKD